MRINITEKFVRTVALVTGGSPGIGAVTVRGLPTHGEAVVSVFMTNGGFSGFTAVVRLWIPLWPKRAESGE
jgi:NAD(P)-dependent dehydrogenase (short-subunit alcohol dehydrogenase family)